MVLGENVFEQLEAHTCLIPDGFSSADVCHCNLERTTLDFHFHPRTFFCDRPLKIDFRPHLEFTYLIGFEGGRVREIARTRTAFFADALTEEQREIGFACCPARPSAESRECFFEKGPNVNVARLKCGETIELIHYEGKHAAVRGLDAFLKRWYEAQHE